MVCAKLAVFVTPKLKKTANYKKIFGSDIGYYRAYRMYMSEMKLEDKLTYYLLTWLPNCIVAIVIYIIL